MTDKISRKRIVLLGGYGVFGGKLAEALLRNPRFDVVVAGRSLESAQAFCRIHGGTPARLDRTAPDFAASLAALAPFVTVDAAGPFQAYHRKAYSVAKAALAAGSHYLDLSDDAAFTRSISSLDAQARDADLAVISGVSSVPALSSAAVEAMKGDFSHLDLIESTILPGNRAPRGLSVIRAILAQTGKPVAVTRDGVPDTVSGWSGLARRRIGPAGAEGLPPRWSSFIGAPDLALFPEHYGARTVLFRAGLELPLLHLGLWLLAWPVRLGLVRSLEPAAKFLRMIAGWLEPFGSDRGGMEVRLAGPGLDGQPLVKTWTLIAEAGDGPHIPAVAAAILCGHLCDGKVLPGARACLGEVTLDDITAATAHLKVATFEAEDLKPALFQEALGDLFEALPASVQALHTVFDKHRWSGEARVTRGGTTLGNLLCRLIGFPPESEATPVTVTIERRGSKEHWLRDFGGKRFKSVLSLRGAPGTGIVQECFGPIAFDIHLRLEGGTLAYPVGRGRFLGIPLPHWLLPISAATEFNDSGRFNFDVKISLPGLGSLVHYRGWLVPDDPAFISGQASDVEALNVQIKTKPKS
ncbi:DUF4166 domain-containing protein [Roseibium sp. M-1]